MKFWLVIILSLVAISSQARQNADSIRVVYESENLVHQNRSVPEYYIDSVLVKNVSLDLIDPVDIASISVVKEPVARIYISLKDEVKYSFVTLKFLADKYLKGKQKENVLFTVDGRLITDAEQLLNENHISSISITSDQEISSLGSGKYTVFKVSSKKEAADRKNQIRIRGKA